MRLLSEEFPSNNTNKKKPQMIKWTGAAISNPNTNIVLTAYGVQWQMGEQEREIQVQRGTQEVGRRIVPEEEG